MTYFLDEHNHPVIQDKYCPKKLIQIIKEAPEKKPIKILKDIRKTETLSIDSDVNEDDKKESQQEDNQVQEGENQALEDIRDRGDEQFLDESLDELGENNDSDIPKKSQKQILQSIYNLKYKVSQKDEIACLDDLEKFVKDNKFNKQSKNEVFVCDALLGDTKESPIVVVFSSLTCMKFLHKTLSSQQSMLALDETYKVNSLGYPLICLVTQDYSHKVFPIAFAPASTGSELTISFMLKSVLRTYESLYNTIPKAKYFMSDSAKYIFASTMKVLGTLEGGHLNCYFHLKDGQRKRGLPNHGVAKEDRSTILEHIEIMHMMITKNHFAKYWSLFKEKYSHYQSYLDYFEKTYMTDIAGKWHYYNVRPNVFLTNNVCESLNSVIKRDWTNRERKSLHIFFNILKESLIDIAKEKRVFKTTPEINIQIKCRATDLEAKNLFINKNNYYFLKKNETEKVDMEMINRFLECDYHDIDDFKNDLLNCVILKWDPISKNASCYCKIGFTTGLCHHKLAVEMSHGVIAKTILLEPNKKRGVKRKARSALVIEEESQIVQVSKKTKKNCRRIK